jgi:hypothetical protein
MTKILAEGKKMPKSAIIYMHNTLGEIYIAQGSECYQLLKDKEFDKKLESLWRNK